MFGRQPRLPVDLAFGLPLSRDGFTSHTQYVQKLKSHLEESYKLASRNSAKVMQRNKTRFDRKVTASDLDIGDRVLVRNVRLRGKHKLADKWESSVYIVVKKAGNLPVYTVRPESQDKPLRTLHRDLLLPCGYLPVPEEEIPTRDKNKSPVFSPVPAADDDQAEDELINPPLHIPLSFEPVKFTIDLDLPPAEQPVDFTQFPGPVTEEDRDTEEDEPKPVEGTTTVEKEQLATGSEEPEIDSGQITSAEVSRADGSLSLDPDTPESDKAGLDIQELDVPDISSYAEEPQEPVESVALDTEDQPLRRSSRTRHPPARLQYTKPGNPLLKSIQTLLHGLSSAFSFAHQADEEEQLIASYPSQPPICCQPTTCARTYMGSGGESVACTK
ncbi:uncharacterized protein LOC129366329 [Poeciliopsis prolifica]|uniref:uncharacterized protein LOC129366329 n=1 Tax=Poeciliopsis prolifica TaxID=188132 RepID=UPI002413525C|nr:uncharacterized protein LOC129366329 [Poeciliopsis prolifica]